MTIKEVNGAKGVLAIGFAALPARISAVAVAAAATDYAVMGGQFGFTRTSLYLAPTHRATPFVQPNPA